MKEKLTVVKVGGAVVEDEQQLAQMLERFCSIEGPKVLVHGGGRRATKVAAELGIETKMVDGRRITDGPMLEVVTMVYGGLVNKHVVAVLQSLGIDAIGLCGADGDIIRSVKRPPVAVKSTPKTALELCSLATSGTQEHQSPQFIDYGFVGDVKKADGAKIARFIEAGLVPVIAPLTHDGEGNILNTNADTMASETAKALAGQYDVTLIFSFEKPGVLSDPDNDLSVIPVITRKSFEQYKATGIISGGMLPKIENALSAVEAGVRQVIITQASAIGSLGGTIIR